MKAWWVNQEGQHFGNEQLVWADNEAQAKAQFVQNEGQGQAVGAKIENITAQREPKMDGWENASDEQVIQQVAETVL